MELSNEQRKRLSRAFEQLMDPETLQEFHRLVQEEGFRKAMSHVDLDAEDIGALRSYLESARSPIGPPLPPFYFWPPW